MKAAANMHSSQPLPEKPAWGGETLKQAREADARAGPGSQPLGGGHAAPTKEGMQDTVIPLVGKQSSADAGTPAMPVSQQSQDRDQNVHEQETDRNAANSPALLESEHSAYHSQPGNDLSFHLTPTLEKDIQQSPPGSAQPKACDQAPVRPANGHSQGPSAEHHQPAAALLQAAQPAKVVLPTVSDTGACTAAGQSKREETELSQAYHHKHPGPTAALSPGAAKSPHLVPGDLPETEVQHCPTPMLTPCPLGKRGWSAALACCLLLRLQPLQ